jgi:hypothetical protein
VLAPRLCGAGIIAGMVAFPLDVTRHLRGWPLGVITAVLALSGCGGGGDGGVDGPNTRPKRPAPATRPGRAQAYRWLVPTVGSPPGVAQENGHRGTLAWRLPGPPGDVGGIARGAVRGYVAEPALVPGQLERIYVSAPGSRTVSVRIFRMGWYRGSGGREVLRSATLRAVRQPPCTHRYATGLTECRWHPTLSFRIPSALPSGVYIAQLRTRQGASDCLFVVLASRPAPLLAQLPTATYEAYNAWGGDSLYPGGADRVGVTGTTQGVEVSYDRPYDSLTGAGQFFARDVAMVRFLERYRYPVSYTTSEAVDQHPAQLIGRRALIDFGHSEYWSDAQARAFAGARSGGTSLLFFSSDRMAWRVRFAAASRASSQAQEQGHVIVAYKERAQTDPDRASATGTFSTAAAALGGSAYVGCITPRRQVAGPPTYALYPWQPSPALSPRWLFRGTGVRASTRIAGIVGYELDARTAASPQGTELLGFGRAACMAARASEPSASRPLGAIGVAETTLYRAPRGAIVFAAGTLSWELGLEPVPSASPQAPRRPDSRLVAITRNLLGRALGPPG